MGSETLPSACYILSDESSIPFYSTSNGYNYLCTFLEISETIRARLLRFGVQIPRKLWELGY